MSSPWQLPFDLVEFALGLICRVVAEVLEVVNALLILLRSDPVILFPIAMLVTSSLSSKTTKYRITFWDVDSDEAPGVWNSSTCALSMFLL